MTGKSLTKFRKIVYRKIFRKPFSKIFHTFALPFYSLSCPTSLCSPQATLHVLRLPHKNPLPLSSFSHRPPYPLGLVIDLVQEEIYDPLGLGVVMTGVVLRWWQWVVGHWASPISLSPDCVTGLRGGLELGRALAPEPVLLMIVMICGRLQWVWLSAFCCDGGLWVFLWWFAVDLQWIAVVDLHL